MASNIFTLRKELEEATARELLNAHVQMTKKALQIRTVKRVLKFQNVTPDDLKFILDPETVFVHPQVSAYLRVYAPAGKSEVAQKFYSADYLLEKDVDAFCDWLEENVRDKSERYYLNVAFAVDGYRGSALRNYKDCLKFGMRESPEGLDWEDGDGKEFRETHVRAVRNIYVEQGAMKPEAVRIGIQNAFDKSEASDPSMNLVSGNYRKFVGASLGKIKQFVEENYICYSENDEYKKSIYA